jgi:hypothetical protein
MIWYASRAFQIGDLVVVNVISGRALSRDNHRPAQWVGPSRRYRRRDQYRRLNVGRPDGC